MDYRKELNIKGIYFSKKLVDLVNKKFEDDSKTVHANMIDLPFDDNHFDYILCIAVYHHLDTHVKRRKALQEMKRVCKPNGQIFLQVWALEQLEQLEQPEQPEQSRRKFIKGDNIVPWKKRDGTLCGERYYHVYEK
jgi:ubiquinone/menaquinone biosynthesis C-methylase UbiE